MANRLSNIVTKIGDKGNTQLGNGKLVPKTHLTIQAIGAIDEVNASLGMLFVKEKLAPEHKKFIRSIQRDLFDFGGELSLPEFQGITETHIDKIESQIYLLNDKLPPLKEFVLPGADELSALAHVARTICRRAERSCVEASQHQTIRAECLKYINRLSDYLFVLARTLHLKAQPDETLWR